ncbi:NAD(+) synthase [Christiangramia forsetii]|uniref:NH(3)-dependent NAD(+) synthetase n=2 Tax=Christiangramia forsetii TaxID=411153 RepID=A0M542_CHRFK|nr:NAD(+) synthase [Christiangramia forsetii]GGG21905.1 NH(3)-dependent NAD(+) synthetase [Christiangramia forsetii]CAL67737.1 NH(3)-dependent NAD(+) synthetase [Christiangramia forsetii KT0803]
MQIEKVADHIINWLKEYATKANMNGFVIGVSGGIDSAVASTLCAKTGLPTLCLEMPIHQSENQVSRARKHIDELQHNFANVSALEVNLTPVFEQFKKGVPQHRETSSVDLALANSRARLRMTTLYYFAGLHKYLVAGTGNKIEDFGVGFYTKYGDGGVDLSPIADLLKSEVYELGEYLNIIEEIMIAAPTDGLFGDSRSDEDQLGASYDELEQAMKSIENGKTELDFEGRQREVFNIYSKLNIANTHKMIPIPVCQIPVHLKK